MPVIHSCDVSFILVSSSEEQVTTQCLILDFCSPWIRGTQDFLCSQMDLACSCDSPVAHVWACRNGGASQIWEPPSAFALVGEWRQEGRDLNSMALTWNSCLSTSSGWSQWLPKLWDLLVWLFSSCPQARPLVTQGQPLWLCSFCCEPGQRVFSCWLEELTFDSLHCRNTERAHGEPEYLYSSQLWELELSNKFLSFKILNYKTEPSHPGVNATY